MFLLHLLLIAASCFLTVLVTHQASSGFAVACAIAAIYAMVSDAAQQIIRAIEAQGEKTRRMLFMTCSQCSVLPEQELEEVYKESLKRPFVQQQTE